MGCYRKGEAEDPEIYVGAVAVVLESYPAAVVAHVTDPRTGIAGESKWLPTVADVRHACETAMKPIRDADERQRRRDESERVLASQDEERAKRKTFGDLVDAYPDVVGRSTKRQLTDREKAQILADLEARKDEFKSPCDAPLLRAQAEARAASFGQV